MAAAVRERRAILFVGAGVSAAVGLPSWRGLIARLGQDLGFDGEEFVQLSRDFRALTEFYKLEKGSIDGVRDCMKNEWRVDDDALRGSELHRIVVELDFPVVYTTNYDHLLERAYALHGRRFNKTIAAKDIAHEDPALPTIVKFHGDIDEADTLVLTETDYFRRLAFEEPLDIKLNADAFGRTVLFIGYSLSDINLRLMLYRMRGIWLETGDETLQPRSYIFMTRDNPVQKRILASWGIVPIVGESADESEALLAFMRKLQSAVRAARRA